MPTTENASEPQSKGVDNNPTSAARRSASVTSIDSARSSTSSRARTSTESARHSSTVKSSSERAPRLATPITPGPDDRVYPMRSVVSVDPSQTPFYAPDHSDGFPGFSAPTPSIAEEQRIKRNSSIQQLAGINTYRTGTASEDNITSGDDSRVTSPMERKIDPYLRKGFSSSSKDYGSSSNGSTISALRTSGAADYNLTPTASVPDTNLEGFPVTARFKHIITTNGHAVITGRDGNTLQRCEDEPIHMPGAVQGFGLLMVLEEEEEGKLIVRTVSENSQKIIGYDPHELFALSSFTDILSDEQADNLLDHIDFIRDEDADVASNGPEVFTISCRRPTMNSPLGRNKGVKLWCAMHVNPKAPHLIICEFELDDDLENPLVPRTEPADFPMDTLDSLPTEEELLESTHAMSKPLRVLRSARKRRGEAAAMEVFNIMSQVQEQLASAPTLAVFLKVLCGVVKELTGFHRVMIYQFDSTFNGRVVTELVDPDATKDLYRGLNFPASDIPAQARELYKINKVRLLYNRDLPTARLVCRTIRDLEEPLDLTYSYLRAMSPIHIKYLANMGVRSSMSISINAFGQLWGLIALHGYGPSGMRVSFPIRKMCRLVGDTASRNIERLSYASRLQARKLINTSPSEGNPSGYIVASSDDLLKLFDADFGMLSIHNETKILGKPEESQELLAILEYLRLRKFSAVLTSSNIKQDFPDAPNNYIKVIAGLLLVPLSLGGSDFIVFFRKGQAREVKWAGNPYEKYQTQGADGYLEPRKSFKTWTETVVGKSREWSEEQIETAAVLCLVYGKFIEVWRLKEAAIQSNQFTRLLLANQAHEVRTPLNAIINYLEIALEGNLDQETRENLTKSHSASKSLIYVINDLLDLTKTEEGQALIKSEVFDLPATVIDATELFKNDAKRKNLEYEVIEHPGIPRFVHGDQRRLGQAVSNLTANAIQHTTTGSVRVEIWLAGTDEDGRVLVDISVQDTGCGMSNRTLDALFRDLEQVSSESEDELFPNDKTARGRTLGLGLAVVARIVRNCGGNLRLKSEEGKGSRFVCQLPFDVPDSGEGGSVSTTTSQDMLKATDDFRTPPVGIEGEVILIDKNSSLRSEGIVRQRGPVEDLKSNRSLKSNHSLQSFTSGESGNSHGSHRSDVDRLIDAISEPLSVGRDQIGVDQSHGKITANSMRMSAESGGVSFQESSPRSERLSRLRHTLTNAPSIPEHLRSTIEGPPGLEYVQDNATPIKAVRMPDDFESDELSPSLKSPVPLEFQRIEDLSPIGPRKQTAEDLQVLVAEDDPINSRIIIKRLEKLGHSCHHTVNGEECATAYGESSALYDVILMDMQMPLVDGLTSTKMIRSYEKTSSQPKLSPRAALNTRVPIFAVSASLVERELKTYISAGFDGWILKPIDFKRLNDLLLGIVDEDVRNSCLYTPGEWERGGWFEKRQPDTFAADTRPDDKTSATEISSLDRIDGSMEQGNENQ